MLRCAISRYAFGSRECGHHLADPDQSHALLFFMVKPRWFSSPQSVVFSLTRTFGFLFDGGRVVTDPHQSPFWIKTLGLPLAGKTPGPWLLGAPEIPQCPGMAKWCESPFIEAARERWTVCVHRERVATGAIRVHRSLAPPRWEVQPLAGFMTEAHQFKSSAARRWWGRMRRQPNQIKWLSANHIASSPPQPKSYWFMRMPCSRQRVPDRAGCSSRPAPACGPRS
jgi:hypothetical protein